MECQQGFHHCSPENSPENAPKGKDRLPSPPVFQGLLLAVLESILLLEDLDL